MQQVQLEYPRQFNAELRDSVELVITRGRQKLGKVRRNVNVVGPWGQATKEWQAAVQTYVLEGCLAFNRAACQLLESGAIPSDKLTYFRSNFLGSLIKEAQYDQGFSASDKEIKLDWWGTSSMGGGWIEREVLAKLQNSSEWSRMLRQQARALRSKLASEQPSKGEDSQGDKKAEKQRRKNLVVVAKGLWSAKGKGILTSLIIARECSKGLETPWKSASNVSHWKLCDARATDGATDRIEKWLNGVITKSNS